MELVSASRRAWEIVNHTPVAIEPVRRLMFDSPSFRVSFEHRDFEGRWRTMYDGSVSGSRSPDGTPLAPGASRPLESYQLSADGDLTPGSWRAIAQYRDPRHPASASYAETVFEIVGLSTAQAEAVLAALAAPETRECRDFASVAYQFVRTAPPEMLPRLLEVPAATVSELETALVTVTYETRDPSLLHRAIVDRNPSMRLAAARALGHTAGHTSRRNDTLPSLALWVNAIGEIYPRWMGAGEGEADDLPTLFGTLPDLPPPVLARLLQRLADRRAPALGVAIAAHFGLHARRLDRAQLPLVARALARAGALETDPATRSYHLRALHDCTAALRVGTRAGWGSRAPPR